MTRRQPGAGTLGGHTAPGHLGTTVPILLIGLAVTTIITPLAVPVAIAAAVGWHLFGGRAGRALLGTLAVTALAVWRAGGPVAVAWSAWQHWAGIGPLADVAMPARLGAAASWLAGFGYVGPMAGLCLGLGWCLVTSTRRHGQSWHPFEAHRIELAEARRVRRAQRVAGRLGWHAEALAVAIEAGNLERAQWRDRLALVRGRWPGWRKLWRLRLPTAARVMIPRAGKGGALALPFMLLGMPGSGKTTLLERLAYLAGRAGVKFTIVDAKGTDADLPRRIETAYRAGRMGAGRREPRVLIWAGPESETAVNGWQGSGDAIVGRLMRVVSFTREGAASYYTDRAKDLIQLACCAPCGPPRSSAELVERLDLNWLASAYKGEAYKAARARIKRLDADEIAQAASRFATLFHTLRGRFDGPEPIEAYDCAIFRVSGLGDPEDAQAVAGFILADLEHLAGVRRNPRHDAPMMVVLDEYGAMANSSELIINLQQRGRSSGMTVVPSMQSMGDVGDRRMQGRMVASCSGGVYALATTEGEEIAHLAGHEDRPDMAWRMTPGVTVESATMRTRRETAIDPDQLGRAQPGELQVLVKRRAARMQVIMNPLVPEAHRATADHLAHLADLYADGPDVDLWADLTRMAQDAAEMAGPRPFEPSPDRPELPEPRPARRLLPDSWRVPPPRTVLAFAGMVLARLARIRVRVEVGPRRGPGSDEAGNRDGEGQ